jgi:hypothetical protein
VPPLLLGLTLAAAVSLLSGRPQRRPGRQPRAALDLGREGPSAPPLIFNLREVSSP